MAETIAREAWILSRVRDGRPEHLGIFRSKEVAEENVAVLRWTRLASGRSGAAAGLGLHRAERSPAQSGTELRELRSALAHRVEADDVGNRRRLAAVFFFHVEQHPRP
jgi:hypothetical protein